MEASLSAIRSFAIYSCDGDPSGAVNVAIEDSRQEAVRRIGDDYELLRDIAQRQAWDNNTPAPLALFDTVAQPKEVSHGQGQRRLPTKDREVRTGYQVFISFKNLDENRNPTPDYALAREVFELLTRDGTRTFFSPVSLEEFGTSAFKRAIDDALDQCQVLVAVGTSREHLESEWVRYEWDGFFHDILMGIKPSARIFSYVKGISPSSLPRVLRQNQVFENEHDGLNRLYQYIRGALSLEPG
jgi:hypothetical protein